MKKISIIASSAIFCIALMTSCKKNNEYNYDAGGGQKIVKFVDIGGMEDNFDKTNIVTDGFDTAQEISMQLEYSAPTAYGQDIVATIGVDTASITAYNSTVTDSADMYALMPAANYTIPVKQVVIKAGEQLSVPVKIILDGTKVDGSKNWMIPVKILSLAGAGSDVKIAAGTNTAFFHFIGNIYAGTYTVYYKRWNSSSATGSPTLQNTYSGIAGAPVSSSNFLIQSGYGEQVGFDLRYSITFKGNTFATANTFAAKLKSADVTSSLGGNGITLASDATITNLDPLNKWFVFTFQVVSSTGAPRVLIDSCVKE